MEKTEDLTKTLTQVIEKLDEISDLLEEIDERLTEMEVGGGYRA